MPNDDQRPGIDWGKYQTLTIERRQDGILLIMIAEPEGYPPASLARRHTEVSWIWRDFDDDPSSRVAVITGRGDKFWTVEGNDGVKLGANGQVLEPHRSSWLSPELGHCWGSRGGKRGRMTPRSSCCATSSPWPSASGPALTHA
jgi:hypothetical protein